MRPKHVMVEWDNKIEHTIYIFYFINIQFTSLLFRRPQSRVVCPAACVDPAL
jgi:hypothetical protein